MGHGSREQKQIRDQSKRERKSCENNEIGTASERLIQGKKDDHFPSFMMFDSSLLVHTKRFIYS